MTISRIIASWFYMGYLRPSGTIGSLGGLPFAYGLHLLGGAWLLLISAVILAFIGWWAAAVEIKKGTNPDPSEIVVDEVVGIWLAMVLPSFLANTEFGQGLSWAEWSLVLMGVFAFFRLLDIAKPWLIGWADRKHGAFFVMLDDIFAGVATAGIAGAVCFYFHGGMF